MSSLTGINLWAEKSAHLNWCLIGKWPLLVREAGRAFCYVQLRRGSVWGRIFRRINSLYATFEIRSHSALGCAPSRRWSNSDHARDVPVLASAKRCKILEEFLPRRTMSGVHELFHDCVWRLLHNRKPEENRLGKI